MLLKISNSIANTESTLALAVLHWEYQYHKSMYFAIFSFTLVTSNDNIDNEQPSRSWWIVLCNSIKKMTKPYTFLWLLLLCSLCFVGNIVRLLWIHHAWSSIVMFSYRCGTRTCRAKQRPHSASIGSIVFSICSSRTSHGKIFATARKDSEVPPDPPGFNRWSFDRVKPYRVSFIFLNLSGYSKTFSYSLRYYWRRLLNFHWQVEWWSHDVVM